MITIDEAEKKWSCSKNTVLSYVYKDTLLACVQMARRCCYPILKSLIFRANVSTAVWIITGHSCEHKRRVLY